MTKMVACGLPIEGERRRGVAESGGDGGCRLWWLQNTIKRAPFGSKCSRTEPRVLIYVAASKGWWAEVGRSSDDGAGIGQSGELCYIQKTKP